MPNDNPINEYVHISLERYDAFKENEREIKKAIEEKGILEEKLERLEKFTLAAIRCDGRSRTLDQVMDDHGIMIHQISNDFNGATFNYDHR